MLSTSDQQQTEITVVITLFFCDVARSSEVVTNV